MTDAEFRRLASVENLMLCVATGDNVPRECPITRSISAMAFISTELAADKCLRDLSDRIIGGTYQAEGPSRVFLAKELWASTRPVADEAGRSNRLPGIGQHRCPEDRCTARGSLGESDLQQLPCETGGRDLLP